MEHNTLFVSSRGLLTSCAAHNARAASSSPAIDDDLLTRHRTGGSIYACTDALAGFVQRLLPRISTPFTLVTGDSDIAVTPAVLGADVFDSLLAHPLLKAWYAQNCAAQHPKLFAMPIGLDYHTMRDVPGMWGLSAVSPVAQERQLMDTWARSPEIHQRYLVGYCNWTATLDRGDRAACLERIDKSACLIEKSPIPRASSWARQAECLFVVSPEGVGMDCHRTWEALALGCIPIVKRNGISPLFDRLPVLIVEDWSEVSRNRMESYLRDFTVKTFDYSRLFRDTWVRLHLEFAANPPIIATYAEFRRMMTRSTG